MKTAARALAILILLASHVLANDLAGQIKRIQNDIAKLHNQLDPLVQPVLVTDADVRIWISSKVTDLWASAYNQADPDKRHFHYDAISEIGNLESNAQGAAGCGWYLTLEGGNSAHADLVTSNGSITWNSNGTINASLDFNLALDATVDTHVNGPPGPCSILHPVPMCQCAIGHGFEADMKTSGTELATLKARGSFTSTPSTWLSYDFSLVSPSTLPITVTVSLGQFGTVTTTLSFDLPGGVLATGSVPSVLGGRGELKVGTPPVINKTYTLTISPSNAILNETGLAVKSMAHIEFK